MKDRILARRARFMAATFAACTHSSPQTLEVAGPITMPSASAQRDDPRESDSDSDGDGVPDANDKCPTIAGIAAEDGCPARPCLSINTDVKILQRVEFPAGQSSFTNPQPMLDEVAEFMKGNARVIVRVQGHGDSTENIAVSAARALWVRSYLEKKGVDPKQLDHVTYGSTHPIAPNTSADGRARNRRVDFEITKQ